MGGEQGAYLQRRRPMLGIGRSLSKRDQTPRTAQPHPNTQQHESSGSGHVADAATHSDSDSGDDEVSGLGLLGAYGADTEDTEHTGSSSADASAPPTSKRRRVSWSPSLEHVREYVVERESATTAAASAEPAAPPPTGGLAPVVVETHTTRRRKAKGKKRAHAPCGEDTALHTLVADALESVDAAAADAAAPRVSSDAVVTLGLRDGERAQIGQECLPLQKKLLHMCGVDTGFPIPEGDGMLAVADEKRPVWLESVLARVELETRLADWRAGHLNTAYFVHTCRQLAARFTTFDVSGLPRGWSAQRAGDTVYYANLLTGESQWTRPTTHAVLRPPQRGTGDTTTDAPDDPPPPPPPEEEEEGKDTSPPPPPPEEEGEAGEAGEGDAEQRAAAAAVRRARVVVTGARRYDTLMRKWKEAKTRAPAPPPEPEHVRREREARIATAAAMRNATVGPSPESLGGVTIHTGTEGAAARGMPDLAAITATLPAGWEALWDATRQHMYYGHRESGTTQWIRPV